MPSVQLASGRHTYGEEMHKIIISKTAKKVISNSQLKTENSAVKMIPAFEQNIRPLETAKQVRKLRVAAYCRVSTGEESQQGWDVIIE